MPLSHSVPDEEFIAGMKDQAAHQPAQGGPDGWRWAAQIAWWHLWFLEAGTLAIQTGHLDRAPHPARGAQDRWRDRGR